MNHLFVAGFDFGTSYSKVVVRDQFSGVAKVVTFGEQGSGLLPSVVYLGEGILFGPQGGQEGSSMLTYPKLFAADAATGRSDFEPLYGEAVSPLLKLLGGDDLRKAAQVVLTRYFLSVLDGIHRFLASDDDWSDFDPEKDPLVVQLAVPTGLMVGKDNPVDILMQEALAAATMHQAGARVTSSFSRIEDLALIEQSLRCLPKAEREALDERCLTYPEVAAGVQAVFRSRNTPDGKYITLDVGAGTVDLNAFHRRSQMVENPRLDYWACAVEPLGFARLNLADTGIGKGRHERSVRPIPEGQLLSQLDSAIEKLLKEAFRFQPHTVLGDGPSPWLHGTHAFAWGGGAGHQPYVDQFLSSLKSRQIGVETINRLPVPGDHFSLPTDLSGNFGRLAVAYGLSYHQANLEAVHLPHQFKSYDELHPVRWEDLYGGETGVCSCRGNPSCPRCMGSGIIDSRKKVVAKLIPSGPLVSDGRQVKIPNKRPNKYQLALKNLVHEYHKSGMKMVVADRVCRLNQIQRLLQRPEVHSDDGLVSDARYILLHNLKSYWGRVRVKPLSAVQVLGGCRVIVTLPRGRLEEMLVEHERPAAVAKVVNSRSAPWHFVELCCSIRKTPQEEFVLFVAPPKRGSKESSRPRRRRK